MVAKKEKVESGKMIEAGLRFCQEKPLKEKPATLLNRPLDRDGLYNHCSPEHIL